MALNINRSVTDIYYRYKMPKVIVKVEGKGNGIKTRIVNMSDIAKALDRPPAYPTKYFGCELGAQTSIDIKSDKYIVNGSHTADKMQDILDGFIQKFVLCPKCENPETTLTVNKSTISQRCMACGERGVLKLVHRLTQYITKNPPNTNANDKKEGKKGRGGKKGKKDSDSEEDKTADSQIAQNYQDEGRNVDQDSPPPVLQDEEDEEEWVTEEDGATNGGGSTGGEGVVEQVSNLTISSNSSEMNPEEKLEMFFKFVENKHKGGSVAKEFKALYGEAERLDIVDKAPYVLTEVLLSEAILKELTVNRVVFLKFCHQNQKAQKNLLAALEMLICKKFPETLLPKTAHILKGLYDLDIVDEEIMIDWQDKSSKKRLGRELSQQIHSKAEPFIKWLKEAEEESDEEDEDDDDKGEDEVEIEYSFQATTGLKETKAKPEANKNADDDLDIDNI